MICPNCKGDGYEDNPPMRRCGVCKGKGKVPDPPPREEPAEKAPEKEDEH